jgi:hypothetical protein
MSPARLTGPHLLTPVVTPGSANLEVIEVIEVIAECLPKTHLGLILGPALVALPFFAIGFLPRMVI